MKRIIYLTLAILVLFGSVSVYATGTNYRTERFLSHESSPHIPSPYNQADVAAGVGISTVGIVIVNALTKTSVFGSASFNGSFNPQAAPSAQPGAGATSGSAPGASGSAAAGTSGTASAGMASTASTAQGAASASMSQGAAAGGSNFIKSIGDFFKGLFDVLRDMLTDEGRTYASGRLTDLLSDINISDMGDES